MGKIANLGLAVAVLAASSAFAQSTARLVTDLAPGFERSPLLVQPATMAGGKAYFSATTGEHGAELWVSTGKPAGTGRVTDLYPGFRSSSPDQMMEMGGKMYFTADDGVHGRELWVSDGTTAGTTLFADLYPGSGSSSPVSLAATSGRLWFTASTSKGLGLWSTDGTAENTVELNPLPAAPLDRAFLVPSVFTTWNNLFYFASSGRLWKSDGTVAGTVSIQDLPQPPGGFTAVTEMAAGGDFLYYIVSTNRRESLWRSTGEAGNAEIIPREPGFESWEILRGLLPVGDKLSFFGQTEDGAELAWRCGDGTLDGSVRFAPQTLGRWNETSVVVGNLVYFGIYNATQGAELCRSDGTLEGTYLLKDIRPGSGSSEPAEFRAAGKWLYFTADDGKKGREIWRTDGTAKGTRLVVETSRGSGSTQPEDFTADGEAIYFLGGQYSPGGDLWRTDGTKKGTVRLTVPEQKGVGGLLLSRGYPQPIAAIGNRVYFHVGHPKYGSELWSSDGTAKATKLVIDAERGLSSSYPQFLTPLGNRMLFTVRPSFEPAQLWSSNGSKPGSFALTNFPESTEPDPQDFARDGDRLFFGSGELDNALWVTDGTRGGTREIPIPGNTPLNLVHGTLRMAGPTLFFASDRRPQRHELWRSDGTPAGTVMVKDAFPEAANTQRPRLDQFMAVGNDVCFFSKTNDLSRLWRSDGTTEGTAEVAIDFAPGNHFRVLTAVPFGDRFLFLADAQNGGLQWWISDGTTGGTRILKDGLFLSPPPHFQNGQMPISAILGGVLYLVIDTPSHGEELWRTDGTADGTFRVTDLMPGPGDSVPAEFQVIGDHLYFAAADLVHGRELWSTDGTAEGTAIVTEVMPGDRSSNPAMLCVAGNRLFFAAENPVAGYELHVLDLPAANSPLQASAAFAATEAGQGTSTNPTDDELLKLAFNLDPASSARPLLEPGRGTAGFPTYSSAPGVFRVEFLRKRDGSLSYTAKCSTSLDSTNFHPMNGPETVVEIDANWERVTIEQPIDPATPRVFGVVEVTEP